MLRDERGKPRDYLVDSLFDLLPEELFPLILSYVYIQDLPAALQLNRYFAQLTHEAWKQKYLPVAPYHHSKGRSPKAELKRFIRDKCGGRGIFFNGPLGSLIRSSVRFKDIFNIYMLGYENRVEDFKEYIEKLNLSKEKLSYLHDYMINAPFDVSFLSQAVRNQIYSKYSGFLPVGFNHFFSPVVVSMLNQPANILEESIKKEIGCEIIKDPRYIHYLLIHNSDQWLDYVINHDANAPQAIFQAMMQYRPSGVRYPLENEKAGYRHVVMRLRDLGLPELTTGLPRTFLSAAESGSVALLEALYQYHQDIEVIDRAEYKTPLINACNSVNVKNVLYLLSKGAQYCGASPLTYIFIEAAKCGDLAAMEELYRLGYMPNLDATSHMDDELTALTAAVIGKRAHVVEWLLKKGASRDLAINHKNAKKFSALNSAVRYPDINTFKLFLGDQVNILMDGVPLWSWLAKILALAKSPAGLFLLPPPKTAIKHYPLLIEWLVDHPAFDINFQSAEGGTGLHWLLENSGLLGESLPEKLVEKLFSRKPNLLAVNQNNETLIDVAQQCAARGVKHAVIDKIMAESGHQQSLTVKLEAAIAALCNYGKLLSGSKNNTITALSKKLYGEVHAFQAKVKQVGEDRKLLEKEYAVFRTNIIDILHDPQFTQSLYAHRAEWKPIVLNILIALTGIGLFIVAGKIAYSAITERQEAHPTFTHLLFFGKTASQNKMAVIEEEVNRLSLSPRG